MIRKRSPQTCWTIFCINFQLNSGKSFRRRFSFEIVVLSKLVLAKVSTYICLDLLRNSFPWVYKKMHGAKSGRQRKTWSKKNFNKIAIKIIKQKMFCIHHYFTDVFLLWKGCEGDMNVSKMETRRENISMHLLLCRLNAL